MRSVLLCTLFEHLLFIVCVLLVLFLSRSSPADVYSLLERWMSVVDEHQDSIRIRFEDFKNYTSEVFINAIGFSNIYNYFARWHHAGQFMVCPKCNKPICFICASTTDGLLSAVRPFLASFNAIWPFF